MASIVEISGAGRTFPLGLTTDIGRDPGSVVTLSDALTSRNHAEIRRTPDGRYRIVDLRSTHGTYVEGKRISEHLLHHGDEIMVGMTRLRFLADEEAGGAEGGDAPAAPVLLRRRVEGAEPRDAFPAADALGRGRDLKRCYEKLRAAYEVSRALVLEDGIDALLEQVADTALRLLDADRVAILLVDRATGEPTPRVQRTKEGSASDVAVSRSILREVLRHRVGIVSADAGSDERFAGAQSIMAAGIRSAMCVPMVHEDEVLGAIHCDTRMVRNAFEEEDLDLFTTIASQAALAVRNVTLSQRIQDEASARVQLQRFFSPGIVDQIIQGHLKVGQKGETRRITPFFLDIRGFTRMSEGMAPRDVVDLLNLFFEQMVEVLFRNQGTLDKYVGDELMALFGAPVDLPGAPLAAVTCALEMMAVLVTLNEENEAADRPRIAMGIGIHTGEALCGVIGSSRTRQYTAMGDTVNTAARLCSAAKPGQILISEATWEEVAASVEAEALPPLEVKGKSKPLVVYEVRGLA